MRLDGLIRSISSEFPDFELRRKDQSVLMKAIDVILRVITFNQMKGFQTEFITTMGCVVYVGTCWDTMSDAGRMVSLRHERVHMRQRKRYGWFLFSLMYLWLPMPCLFAYFRAKFEKEAYEETIFATVELYEEGSTIVRSENFKNLILDTFTTAQYFWMWPFRKGLERWYAAAVVNALTRHNFPQEQR